MYNNIEYTKRTKKLNRLLIFNQSGRIPFVKTGFGFYPKNGFCLHAQMLWTVWFWRGCLGNESNNISIPAECASKYGYALQSYANNVLYAKLLDNTRFNKRLYNKLLIEKIDMHSLLDSTILVSC